MKSREGLETCRSSTPRVAAAVMRRLKRKGIVEYPYIAPPLPGSKETVTLNNKEDFDRYVESFERVIKEGLQDAGG